jgi:5-methylcytosine-specific restriction protein A
MEIRQGNQTAIREFLLRRDGHLCASCGTDIVLLKKVLMQAIRCCGWEDLRGFEKWCKEKQIPLGHHHHTWEADHIIPLHQGGTHHEDNLQILCLICHKAKTKEERSK